MLQEAFLIALWAGITGIDQFNILLHIHRPIITGPVVGFILGDFQTGLAAGATLELVWMGMAPLAGAQPPNVVIGGIIGTVFAILSGQDPKTAVSVAVPFAVAAQGAITLLFTAYSPLMHKADEYAAEAKHKATDMLNLSGMVVLFVFNFVVAFLPVYFGADAAKAMVDIIPTTLLDGLAVAGGMMPALGFAMLLSIMLKKEYVAFLLVGFVVVTYFDLTLVGTAIIGVAIALYDYYSNNSNDNNQTPKKEAKTNGI
ncbi:PTS N-acetylgalactosamine transporter subunit IIC [Sporohalobacter salinus]|uniref:PTS N-acetylgalactosamine transporter subunit IIC n=1 Tax=Sporohalobacter salinus TaxID=1494606 RepID=UPI00196118C5|nr:PTS N-acetylgalactosamine transporter subunit IIC [Sporohalobacter salinus]MBM7624586.1 PTS system N-acetylgalactosamine-specific IIC component [Sporohalobacter salinus]